ncbi:MAG TPA: flagellar biosynthetic protein FliO, partial [Saprospiraceae bacterium]|nr:flagellar biosynthetic protein FliO [Saprospiraceae bacterium]
HAITFAIVSMAILLLPLFWAPLSDQGITPLATTTPTTISQMLAATPTPAPTAHPAVAQASPAAPPTASASATPAAKASPTPLAEEPAAEAQASATQTRYHDPTMEFSGQLRRIVLSLLVTTLLIAFTLKAAQKHIPALGGQKPGSFMNILAREAISPTQSLALVKVGAKILLVGLSEQNMTTLSEFSEADLESLIPKAPEPEARTAKSMYGDVLRHYLSIVPGLGAKK